MKTALIFPGQGSQFVGMGQDIFDAVPEIRDKYQQANDILGFDITKLSFNGPDEELGKTNFTQPAIFIHSYLLFSLLKDKGIQFDVVAGHSLGEYSALAAAQALDFENGLALVKARGQLMANAGTVQQGAMAALIGLDFDKVSGICETVSKEHYVALANFNSPTQIVISGSIEGVDAALKVATDTGAKRALKLNVSGAFHSKLMEPAIQSFPAELENAHIKDAIVPVYANVTGQPITNATDISKLLLEQLTSPVLWTNTIEQMVKDGVTKFYEVGPGSVLSGLLKRIDRKLLFTNINSFEHIENFNNE